MSALSFDLTVQTGEIIADREQAVAQSRNLRALGPDEATVGGHGVVDTLEGRGELTLELLAHGGAKAHAQLVALGAKLTLGFALAGWNNDEAKPGDNASGQEAGDVGRGSAHQYSDRRAKADRTDLR